MSDPRQGYTHYDPTQAGPVFGNQPTSPSPHGQQHPQGHQDQPAPPHYEYQQHPPHPHYPPPGQYTTPYPGFPGATTGPPPENGAGMTALILGILTFAVSCLPLGIGAIIAGHIGMNKVKRGEADNYTHAKAGVIMGYIGLGLMLAIVVFYVVVFVIVASSPGSMD